MIAKIRGTVVEKNLTSVVVDVAGLGYEVFVSVQTLQKIPSQDEFVTLYTYLHVREDAMLLYGFSSAEEKSFFEKCIAISGVGPKLALSILSGHDLESTIAAIRQGDIARLTKIPGVGKKTAERLIMELRDKVNFYPVSLADKSQLVTGEGFSLKDQQVLTALCQLGYKMIQAESALKSVRQGQNELPIEELLRQSLAFLQST